MTYIPLVDGPPFTALVINTSGDTVWSSSHFDTEEEAHIEATKKATQLSKPIEMISVTSSNINQIGYDQNKRELHVTFNSNSTYIYSDVPPDIYLDFLDAPSQGKFLHAKIKNVFKFRKV